MSVKLKVESTEDFVIASDDSVDIDKLPDGDLQSAIWYAYTAVDEKGVIRYFDLDIWNGDPIGLLEDVISYLESHPVPGTYTVEELGLHDVPFVEVLKAIKKLYEKKLTTPTQK